MVGGHREGIASGVENVLCHGLKEFPTKFSYGQYDDNNTHMYHEPPPPMRFGTQIEGLNRGVHPICCSASCHVKIVFLSARGYSHYAILIRTLSVITGLHLQKQSNNTDKVNNSMDRIELAFV